MNRYARRFRELQQGNSGAFVPFLVVGDPDAERSLEFMQALVAGGADMLELGIPFSDPLADGPVIQDAMARGLASGATPESCLETIRRFRQADQTTPIGLLVYANLVYRAGAGNFYRNCAAAGVDSVLVPDVPLDECDEWVDEAVAHGVDPVLICPPNASEQDISRIAGKCKGYTYLLSRAGVTGTSVAAGRPVRRIVSQLREYGAPPALLGFGISHPEHVRAAMEEGVDGVICGSAIVKMIASWPDRREKTCSDLSAFTAEMKGACRLGK